MNKWSLNNYEVSFLIAALDFFMTSDVEGVSTRKKLENNMLAYDIKDKLANTIDITSAEEFRVIYISLYLLKVYLEENKFIPSNFNYQSDFKDCLSMTTNLLNMVKVIFKKSGINL